MLGRGDILNPRRLHFRALQDAAGASGLVRQGEGDDGAGGAGAGGAAGAVHVLLDPVGRIDMDHHGDVIDVQAAGGHIGRDEHAEGAFAEPGEHIGAQALLLAAVQSRRGDPHLDELLRHPLGAQLGAGEQQGPALTGGELRGDLAFGGRGDLQHVVVHRLHGRADGGGLMTDGIHQKGIDELLDLPVQGGGEQHLLGAHLDRGENVPHLRQEPQVCHVVRLVHDGGLH